MWKWNGLQWIERSRAYEVNYVKIAVLFVVNVCNNNGLIYRGDIDQGKERCYGHTNYPKSQWIQNKQINKISVHYEYVIIALTPLNMQCCTHIWTTSSPFSDLSILMCGNSEWNLNMIQFLVSLQRHSTHTRTSVSPCYTLLYPFKGSTNISAIFIAHFASKNIVLLP